MNRNQTHITEIKKLIKPYGKNWEIYLHGSRRMAEQLNVTALLPSDTDYDYAVGNPKQVEHIEWEDRKKFVRHADSLGWSVLGNEWRWLPVDSEADYFGSASNFVKQKEDPNYDVTEVSKVLIWEKEIDGAKVQVQWKADFVHYKDMFESINPSYFFEHFYKKNRDQYKEYLKAQMKLRVPEKSVDKADF